MSKFTAKLFILGHNIKNFFHKKDYTALYAKNFAEHSYNLVVHEHNESISVCGPRIYYGMIHEVEAQPNIRYVSTGIGLFNLVSDKTIHSGEQTRKKSTILFCNPNSRQELTINGWTIALSRYSREQVLEFIKKFGIKVYEEQETV